MLGDVNIRVEDGNLGRSDTAGTGIQVKIGVSDSVSDGPVKITKNMTAKKIKELLGYSPLADACMDSVENGAGTIYCVPVAATTAGTVSEVKHEGSGNGTITVSGKPCNAYSIIVKITESGELNAGAMKYSIDGGTSYSDEETLPSGGKYALQGTGLELTFAGGFTEGDTYTVTTTEPSMSNQGLMDAVEGLRNFNKMFELIHVVGASTKATWAALAAVADKYRDEYKRPVMFVCESRMPGADETAEAYASELISDRKGISSIYLQVITAAGRYVRMDGRTKAINLSGVITGFYGIAKESQSVGEVDTFPISSEKLLELLPAGIEEYIEELDGAGYCTVRQYHGLEEYYVANARMLSPENSDFRYAEEVRVLNRIVRDIRITALGKLQGEIDTANLESDLARIQAELNVPIDKAVSDQIISSGDVTVDNDTDILADEEINLHVTYVPKGHIRAINATVAVSNPYTA